MDVAGHHVRVTMGIKVGMGSRVVKTVVIKVRVGTGVKAMFGARRGSPEQGHGRGLAGGFGLG